MKFGFDTTKNSTKWTTTYIYRYHKIQFLWCLEVLWVILFSRSLVIFQLLKKWFLALNSLDTTLSTQFVTSSLIVDNFLNYSWKMWFIYFLPKIVPLIIQIDKTDERYLSKFSIKDLNEMKRPIFFRKTRSRFIILFHKIKFFFKGHIHFQSYCI